MRYVEVELLRQARETAYRIYITDTLQDIAINTARLSGGHFPTERFIDRISCAEKKPDLRTGDEIAADILSGLASLRNAENGSEEVDE